MASNPSYPMTEQELTKSESPSGKIRHRLTLLSKGRDSPTLSPLKIQSLLAASCTVKPKNSTLQSGWLGSSARADMHLHLGVVAGQPCPYL